MGNGSAMAGNSFPCEKPPTESVPINGLASMTGGVPSASAVADRAIPNSENEKKALRFFIELRDGSCDSLLYKGGFFQCIGLCSSPGHIVKARVEEGMASHRWDHFTGEWVAAPFG